MWTKATVLGGIAAVTLVAGGAGMAIASAQSTTGSDVAAVSALGGPSPTVAPSARAGKVAKDGLKRILGRLKDFQHAEWVTKGDGNSYVTHEAILGQIQAVSSTAITVASSDGTSMTFAVDGQTKVRQRRAQGTATPAIGDLKTGQTVLVGGDKTPDLSARNILVRAS